MHKCTLYFAFFLIYSLHIEKYWTERSAGNQVGQVICWISSVCPFRFDSHLSTPRSVTQAADLEGPINRPLALCPAGSVKGSLWQEIGCQERVVERFFLCSQPARSPWLVGALMQSFSQAANLLLSLMPGKAKGSLLLLVLELVTIPCWFAKSCLHLWKWSLYLTPLDLPNWLCNFFPALSLVIKQMGRWGGSCL